jgi:hydroxypyruvate isomerase
MSWNFRYASHLGYRSPESPLFLHSVGSADPVAHIDFAADLGFSGVQYALAVTRPEEELNRVSGALARRGLEPGCLIYAPLALAKKPLWGTKEPDAVSAWQRQLRRSFAVAKTLNARHIAILSAAEPSRPIAMQHAALIENLKRAAEDAEQQDLVLCLETLSRRSLPGMLLTRIAEAYAVVKAVGSPAVRLIFDTSHVQIMDGDLLQNLRDTWDAIALIQIADNPDRLEPGKGEINFKSVFRTIRELGYSGLVELEHNWSTPSKETEERGIKYLRYLDNGITSESVG